MVRLKRSSNLARYVLSERGVVDLALRRGGYAREFGRSARWPFDMSSPRRRREMAVYQAAGGREMAVCQAAGREMAVCLAKGRRPPAFGQVPAGTWPKAGEARGRSESGGTHGGAAAGTAAAGLGSSGAEEGDGSRRCTA